MLFIEIGQVFVEIWEGKETPNLVFGPGKSNVILRPNNPTTWIY